MEIKQKTCCFLPDFHCHPTLNLYCTNMYIIHCINQPVSGCCVMVKKVMIAIDSTVHLDCTFCQPTTCIFQLTTTVATCITMILAIAHGTAVHVCYNSYAAIFCASSCHACVFATPPLSSLIAIFPALRLQLRIMHVLETTCNFSVIWL